jgi:Ser-tRNA(Ala) deacylase AlaX
MEQRPADIVRHFEGLSDPRTGNAKTHIFLEILIIAICAVICGADGWSDIELFGKNKKEWLKTFLKLPKGIPSHDTFGRVFAKIKPEEFQKRFIEWVRRYQLMRTHTALHILCGTVFRDYGAKVTGGDMDPLKGRMDFEFENMHGELVHAIEAAANHEIQQGREIKVKILPRDEAFQIPDLIRTKINLLPEGIMQVRTVEIVGLDLQADGGTHVKNTSEVGKIKVADYKSKGAINKRIYIEVQRREVMSEK